MVVTGGASGIGVDTCAALAKAGDRVYLCARSRPLLPPDRAVAAGC
jgi:NAD(P)-dependent dehydrogenase (short-subunit alcohol dehydrogenase family)